MENIFSDTESIRRFFQGQSKRKSMEKSQRRIEETFHWSSSKRKEFFRFLEKEFLFLSFRIKNSFRKNWSNADLTSQRKVHWNRSNTGYKQSRKPLFITIWLVDRCFSTSFELSSLCFYWIKIKLPDGKYAHAIIALNKDPKSRTPVNENQVSVRRTIFDNLAAAENQWTFINKSKHFSLESKINFSLIDQKQNDFVSRFYRVEEWPLSRTVSFAALYDRNHDQWKRLKFSNIVTFHVEFDRLERFRCLFFSSLLIVRLNFDKKTIDW